jgi:hypothetical protein
VLALLSASRAQSDFLPCGELDQYFFEEEMPEFWKEEKCESFYNGCNEC